MRSRVRMAHGNQEAVVIGQIEEQESQLYQHLGYGNPNALYRSELGGSYEAHIETGQIRAVHLAGRCSYAGCAQRYLRAESRRWWWEPLARCSRILLAGPKFLGTARGRGTVVLRTARILRRPIFLAAA